jgi:hypothetical protein
VRYPPDRYALLVIAIFVVLLVITLLSLFVIPAHAQPTEMEPVQIFVGIVDREGHITAPAVDVPVTVHHVDSNVLHTWTTNQDGVVHIFLWDAGHYIVRAQLRFHRCDALIFQYTPGEDAAGTEVFTIRCLPWWRIFVPFLGAN